MSATITYLFISFSLLSAQATYNLYSPKIELPQKGSNESIHYDFWLHADMPDHSQADDQSTPDIDESEYLADYYRVSLLDVTATSWHSTSANSEDGNNFWCADNEVSGYLDSWIQYLDTPSILVGNGGEFSSRIYFFIEDATGPFVDGSCADGWDVANIRISLDEGNTWVLLEDPLNPYHFECGYGWIWNDDQYDTGGSINHLAKGWGGSSNGWVNFSADLSEFANEDVIIRFAFGSDPAYSTADDGTLTGFQVDDISISDDSGLLFSESGDDMSQMIASGEVWLDQFYDYGSIEDMRPGAADWEQYIAEMPFNGNVLMDISNFAEKKVQFRIQTLYDDNHYGGQGSGLFIDNFRLYKKSTAIYPSPEGLSALPGSGEVNLFWTDMNLSGEDDFVFHNGNFSESGAVSLTEAGGSAWAGERFEFMGPSTVNTIKVISINADPVEVTIGGFESSGEIIKLEPTYSLDVTLVPGENTFDGIGWEMNNSFILGYSFSDIVIAGLDASLTSDNSWFMVGGFWEKWSDLVAANEELNHGDWGISAIIAYEGANVTYNVYRDETIATSGLNENSYTDTGLANNTTYEYTVSATYSDGEESEKSNGVEVTPFADTAHTESHDDGSFEADFKAGSGNFSAVRFSAGFAGEDIVRFKWFQNGSGGAFYIKVFEDDGGMPGAETYSTIQASNNADGWNEKDLSSDGLNVSGDFWIGTKEFSSSRPFGLDTSSDAGNSYQRAGSTGDWTAVSGNIAYHVYLDCGDNCDEGTGREFAQSEDETEHFFQVPIYQFSMQNKKPSLVPVKIDGNQLYRKQKTVNNLGRSFQANDEILFECDFENSEANEWTHDVGWNLSTVDYAPDSPIHSYNSPNSNSLSVESGIIPGKYNIIEIYPNPFNPIANIQFEVAEFSQVKLSIIDLNGRLISVLENGKMNPGQYQSLWDGNDSYSNQVSSGIYLAVLESNGMLVQMRKLILLK